VGELHWTKYNFLLALQFRRRSRRFVGYILLKLKHQRFDGDRDGAGGLEDVAEVDELEVL